MRLGLKTLPNIAVLREVQSYRLFPASILDLLREAFSGAFIGGRILAWGDNGRLAVCDAFPLPGDSRLLTNLTKKRKIPGDEI